MMEKSSSNQTNPENIENSEPEIINSHIKQLETLRKSVKKSNTELEYWRNQKSKLLESNSNIEMSLDKLSQKVVDIEKKMSEDTKVYVAKKQELKDLQTARTDALYKQWDVRLSEINNYANDFSQWITNYSRQVLMKEIESHQKECKTIGEELAILKGDLDDMRRECSWDHIEANVDEDDLSSLNVVISNINSGNNNLIRNIRLEEDASNKIENEIKQKKIALNKAKELKD